MIVTTRIKLPYPPSVNHYYIKSKDKVVLDFKARKYRQDVNALCARYRNKYKDDDRLMITVNVFAPDKRKRDLDNLLKAIFDALENAKVFKDDNQIDMLTMIRRDVVKQGLVEVHISKC